MTKLLFAACTFNTTVDRPDDAPNVPASDHVAVVSVPPRDAIRVGTITVRGNRNNIGAPCEAEAVTEAKRLGATHLLVTPVETTAARGARCTGDAYYLRPVVPR